MKRSINNSTLLRQTTNEQYSITQNYCPLPPKNTPKNNQEEELNEEAQELLHRYKELVLEINKIRGKLYTNGIDPDKY
jgi:hypothetical protein